MFEGPVANLKHKLDLAFKTTLGATVAFATALVALGFFCAAAFLSIDRSYGAIVASLVLGGAFLAVSIISLLVILILRSRRPPPPRPAPPGAWWSDPALLATALDLSRALGRRRLTAIVLIGAFVAGIALNRPPKDPEA